jgi:hypothetical protein
MAPKRRKVRVGTKRKRPAPEHISDDDDEVSPEFAVPVCWQCGHTEDDCAYGYSDEVHAITIDKETVLLHGRCEEAYGPLYNAFSNQIASIGAVDDRGCVVTLAKLSGTDAHHFATRATGWKLAPGSAWRIHWDDDDGYHVFLHLGEDVRRWLYRRFWAGNTPAEMDDWTTHPHTDDTLEERAACSDASLTPNRAMRLLIHREADAKTKEAFATMGGASPSGAGGGGDTILATRKAFADRIKARANAAWYTWACRIMPPTILDVTAVVATPTNWMPRELLQLIAAYVTPLIARAPPVD